MTTSATQQKDSGIAIAAMILGTLSITGFGLILGVPAIVVASIALKNKMPGRNLSIAGLITGIIGTILSLLFIAFVILAALWSTEQPSESPRYLPNDSTEQQPYESMHV
ncbi:MAG TPA: DUF4190 domain-containing protein [Candidatus Saccharimonadales bacterium]|nr:DUF4190 domain-containing protein [Candidatus Saccharimonadales bacterium]